MYTNLKQLIFISMNDIIFFGDKFVFHNYNIIYAYKNKQIAVDFID